jgi:predicted DNA-binding transcriptional regulator YafY
MSYASCPTAVVNASVGIVWALHRPFAPVASTISTALKSSERLKIVCHSRGSTKPTARVVEPYGVLTGVRRYLVAKPKADTEGALRYYVAERIQSAELSRTPGEDFSRTSW